MGKYDPSWSPNEGDSALRYAFQNQPDVSAWNCERLAEAFSSIVGEEAGRSPSVCAVVGNFLMYNISSTLFTAVNTDVHYDQEKLYANLNAMESVSDVTAHILRVLGVTLATETVVR